MPVREWITFYNVYRQMRMSTVLIASLSLLNGALIASTAGLAIWLWDVGVSFHRSNSLYFGFSITTARNVSGILGSGKII